MSPRAAPIVRHPAYDAALPDGHRFPMGKFAALAALLQDEGLAGDGFHEPAPASRAQLCLAHDAAYVDAVLAAGVDPAMTRRIGLPVTAGVAARSAAAAGGTLLTARLALAHGLACNTAGGSHHAFRDGGAGFCVFNDVAVAALSLLEEGALRRALVVDCDVHQGDGTAAIFADDPRVFTLSLHCDANFPSRKQRSDLDIGLPKGTQDEAYLEALDSAVRAALSRFAPDLVFYNAGVDVHAEDALGFLALSDAGIAARDRLVLEALHARAGLPIAGVLGGGYGPDVTALARRHAILHRTTAAVFAARSTAPTRDA
jgi:acetoin utilization deacetylase AcuC-like enzyme